MTTLALEQAARERYNAVGETFWSSSEVMTLIYAACLEISTETKCIEQTYTTSTTASIAEYGFPTTTIAIKRVTYEGQKLTPIDQRQADSLTLNNTTTSIEGTPTYYTEWNNTITLIPTPAAVGTLKIWSINEPQAVTSASTLEVPTFCHMRIVNYMLSEMYAKDKDFSSAKYYKDIWMQVDLPAIKAWWRKKKRTDSFASVINEDALPNNILGLT